MDIMYKLHMNDTLSIHHADNLEVWSANFVYKQSIKVWTMLIPSEAFYRCP